MSARRWVCVFATLLLAVPAFAITTKSIKDGLTADQVAAVLTGPGAVISNVRITGGDTAIGSYNDAGALGIDSGVVLSTGNIADAAGPNSSGDTGASLGQPGHPALDQLVKPYTTNDATILEFDVVTESPTFAIRYVFASEEYREWVDSEYNDVFAFFVNGSNIALTPGTGDPVTINTINHLRNQGLYRDNEGGVATQFDGYTVPLLAVAVVEPGVTHHIRIAIADASDGALDSAVLIAQGGISGSLLAPTIIAPERIPLEYGTQGTEVVLPMYYAFEGNPPSLSATGVPDGTVTFTPMYRGADGRFYTNMRVVAGANTPSGTHVLTIRSAIGEAEAFATTLVILNCQPPTILGTGHPATTIVDRNSTATLRVTPQGSTPFTYQWYRGFTGMTRTPVSNSNSAELSLPNLTESNAYWVRVSNPCGSTDSLTAFAMPR